MRTPGRDEDLAAGFLYGEGLIVTAPQAGLSDDCAANTIEIRSPLARQPASRRFYATSSCGVCGKGALEDVAVYATPLPERARLIARGLLASLPDRLVQPGFAYSGRLHATGLFDHAGRVMDVAEDVGRHNAMDKVIGRALLDGRLPLHDRILSVSGRISYETRAEGRGRGSAATRRHAALARHRARRRSQPDALRRRAPRPGQRVLRRPASARLTTAASRDRVAAAVPDPDARWHHRLHR
jgi:hypothetical protein